MLEKLVSTAGIAAAMLSAPLYAQYAPEARAKAYSPAAAQTVQADILANAPYGIDLRCQQNFTEARMPSLAQRINAKNSDRPVQRMQTPVYDVYHMTQGTAQSDFPRLCGGIERHKVAYRKKGKLKYREFKERFTGGKAHFYILKNGTIAPIVPLTWTANHAGTSYYNGQSNISRISYGYELEGMHCPTPEQIVALNYLSDRTATLGVTFGLTHTEVAISTPATLRVELAKTKNPEKRRELRETIARIGSNIGIRGRKIDGACFDMTQTRYPHDILVDPDSAVVLRSATRDALVQSYKSGAQLSSRQD